MSVTGEAGPAARLVLDADQIQRACARIAHQILEANRGAQGLVLLGIPTRGVALARRLAAAMAAVEGVEVPVGALDVTMYRDDLRRQPTRAVGHTHLPGPVDGSTVVLVDDVLYSGRTVRAALDALGDLGRPRIVRLAVLVDRGHRELPIRADHVGKNIPTRSGERVGVRLAEVDGVTEVTIIDEVDPLGRDVEENDLLGSDPGLQDGTQHDPGQDDGPSQDDPGQDDRGQGDRGQDDLGQDEDGPSGRSR